MLTVLVVLMEVLVVLMEALMVVVVASHYYYEGNHHQDPSPHENYDPPISIKGFRVGRVLGRKEKQETLRITKIKSDRTPFGSLLLSVLGYS